MAALYASIAAVQFFGDGGRGDEPFRFVVAPDGFTGWDDGVSTRREDTALPQAHGSFFAPGFGAARVPAFSGNCVARTPQDLKHAGELLTGLLADGGLDRLQVEREGVTTWADVGLAPSSATSFKVFGYARTVASFQIQFWSPDPNRYGEAQTFASADAVYHYGNFAASPVITVTGSNAGGYTINGPSGKKFIVTQPLVAGHPHVIDMATGFLAIDGVVINGGVTQADLWPVGPGQQVVHTITGAGASLSTSVLDTYR